MGAKTDHQPNSRCHRARMAIAALCLFGGLEAAKAQQSVPPAVQDPVSQPDLALSPADTIGDLLHHPDFAGFAERLLPWAGRSYDEAMPLAEMARLLPYHSAVMPDEVVAGLNRILRDQQSGKPVFHDIYSDAERAADPDLEATGLFFFPGAPGAPFAIVAPGGGFAYVGSVHEGFPYAMALADLGFNAFVVTYRTGQGGRIATADMARAIDHVFEHAEDLNVAREGYSVWGSSAGARMAAFIGSHGPDGFGGRTTLRPAAVVMAYTSHSDMSSDEPPTYAIVGARDGIAPPGNMRPRVQALETQGTDVLFRIVPDIGHGFGSGRNTPAAGWIHEAAAFWQAHLPDDVLHPMGAEAEAAGD